MIEEDRKALAALSWSMNHDKFDSRVCGVGIAALLVIFPFNSWAPLNVTGQIVSCAAAILVLLFFFSRYTSDRVEVSDIELLGRSELTTPAKTALASVLASNGEKPLRKYQLQKILALHFEQVAKDGEADDQSRHQQLVADLRGKLNSPG